MRYQERQNADPNNQLLAKNFPGDITIDQIRGYFRQFGRLEDVQIIFTHGGPGEKDRMTKIWIEKERESTEPSPPPSPEALGVRRSRVRRAHSSFRDLRALLILTYHSCVYVRVRVGTVCT